MGFFGRLFGKGRSDPPPQDPPSDRSEPSEPLLELIFAALDHAAASITGSDGPLIPFVMYEAADGRRELARFTTGNNPDEARQHARAHVPSIKGCIRYAVAADGFVSMQGTRFPVVMVEAGEKGQLSAFCFIQRFSSRGVKFAEPFGNPGILERPSNLITSR